MDTKKRVNITKIRAKNVYVKLSKNACSVLFTSILNWSSYRNFGPPKGLPNKSRTLVTFTTSYEHVRILSLTDWRFVVHKIVRR